MKHIQITVRPDGSSEIETKGFTGSECRQASEFLERALGQQTKEQLTAEFHSSANTTTDEHLRQQE